MSQKPFEVMEGLLNTLPSCIVKSILKYGKIFPSFKSLFYVGRKYEKNNLEFLTIVKCLDLTSCNKQAM